MFETKHFAPSRRENFAPVDLELEVIDADGEREE